MVKMELPSESVQELKQIQRNVLGADYLKVTTLLMLHQEISISVISDSLGIDVSTIYRYAALYRSGGVSALTQANYKGYWGLLSSRQISLLRAELNHRIYTDSKQVCAWIENAFGVVYTQSGIVDLLNRIGFTYKKTKEVPCECDAEKQQAFMEKLSELLSQADESSVVYYADGVHPTHNSRSACGWIEKGKELNQPTVSGRDRININGLLNAHDVTDVIARECESVNAQSTKELYTAALEKHLKAKHIYIISDNAKYYKNKELSLWIDNHPRIIQLFLPPYSPNINLIERLWKFVRKKSSTHIFTELKKNSERRS